ncbi:MAG: hypothetical protein PSV36_03155 [Algoriphagus sp.]|nr:hypothetical protein [Algoriphagus sp.]
MANRVYKESQTYRGTWVFYLILLVELPTLILLAVLFFTSEEKKETGIALVFVFGVMSLVLALILNIKLETRIDHQGIQFRYLPFIRKWRLLSKASIISAEVISFNPLLDFGGWGMKGNRTTKLFNITGNQGLLVESGASKKILLGTLKAKELKSFLEDWIEE